ncbi:hypothetical protein W911_06130 [Hyphomicrobium nitrativorans NL23]|uniref:MobA/VirD2-like nuclease domain-containing protein n=1 Tax=Hyphomicrobium nitrativorans NL23 TaxID=1029756 RepID=V5SC02_9HYPH|nr:hypothetical protein [Hyphomicrobium nitrativorans]AHB48058.1 hypothetical protein W911_06130 [Hyphomicrobium nitrativorans NL23]
MILKASQRGGGKQLALHLLNARDNEHVEVHEIRGFASDDVVGALKEAHATSRGTKCRQFLFSVSLSPPPQERVANEVFEDAIQRIEENNNLKGQPRIVLFHEKEGRRHAHAVWSRIDAETMTARTLSHFKLKLRDISRELYLENDWKMPRGLMNSREADPRNFSLAEWQQAKRLGRDARDLKAMMQECWAASDSHAAFAQALKARGFTLAKGDRRGHVALSPEGEMFSVARMVGKKAKEVRARLGDPETLPDVHQVKAQIAKDLSATFKRHMREADEQKRRDLAPLESRRQVMVQAQQQERARLIASQQERWRAETTERQSRFRSGVRAIWDRLSGRHAEIRKTNEREAYASLARDREQRQLLIFAQMQDRQALQADIKAMRDRHAALLNDLRHDQQQARQIARPEAGKEVPRSFRPPTMDERLQRLREGKAPSKAGRNRDFDHER